MLVKMLLWSEAAVFHLEGGGVPWDFPPPPLDTSFPPLKYWETLINFSIHNAKDTNTKT